MKYMLLFSGTVADDEAWHALPPEQREAGYAEVMGWFERNGPKVESGYELQPVATATTVRKRPEGGPVVTDGPFAESGEVVGGYVIVNVADLDEALGLAKSWPGGSVEVRPVVER